MKMASGGGMIQAMVWAYAWAALAIGRTVAVQAPSNPMEKVIELLDVLNRQIEKDGKEDAATYEAYIAFYHNQTKNGEKIIKDNHEKISQLQSDAKESEAFREGKNRDLTELASKLAKDDMELTAGRDGRKKERALFEKNEAVFVESLDQLEHALTVMAKKMPQGEAAAAASSASLLTVAQRLKNTLTKGFDFSLSTAQRETLDSFMRQAQMSTEPGNEEPVQIQKHLRRHAKPASFLQYHSHHQGNGEGLITTLQDLHYKVESERESGRFDEEQAHQEYQAWESGLNTMLEDNKKSLSDIKSAIAQSQEQSSQKQASLMESTEIYKTEVKHMEMLEAEFRGKTQAYKGRLAERSDEAIAVHEAQRILSSEIAKSYIKSTIGSPSPANQGGASFFQLSQEKRADRSKVIHLLTNAKSPGLVLLALNSFNHLHRHNHKHGAEPFAKVKDMIKGMLVKLQEKQAEESRHAAWCDSELGKTAKTQKRKQDDVQKMKDRLEALSAELTQGKSDIETLNKDLREITQALATAKRIRGREHKQALNSMKQYQDGASLLEKATNVLKLYYMKKAGETTADVKEFKDRHGLGTGIIGILEIAIDDFEKLHTDAKEAEAAAVKDFQETQDESKIRLAVFDKDLEWKGRNKVKLEFDQATLSNDLKSYEKELTAIDVYMSQLKASCSVKRPTYEEKKAQREAELQSLNEALQYLKGNTP